MPPAQLASGVTKDFENCEWQLHSKLNKRQHSMLSKYVPTAGHKTPPVAVKFGLPTAVYFYQARPDHELQIELTAEEMNQKTAYMGHSITLMCSSAVRSHKQVSRYITRRRVHNRHGRFSISELIKAIVRTEAEHREKDPALIKHNRVHFKGLYRVDEGSSSDHDNLYEVKFSMCN